MKKYFLIPALTLFSFSVFSQTQETPVGKFIIGTSPLTYSMGSQTSATQTEVYNSITSEYNVQTDSAHATNKTLKAHINLFAGYFITKNICAGLQFGTGTASNYSTFIRYYFSHKNPDSCKFDFFFQANGTLSFSNTDNPAITNYYAAEEYGSTESTSTTEYHTMQNSWEIGLGIAAAYHLTRHWSLELEVGFTYTNSIQTTGSYTSTSTYYYGPYQNYPAKEYSYLGLKNKSYTDSGVLKFMLSYRI